MEWGWQRMSLGGNESLSDLHDCESEQHIIRKAKMSNQNTKWQGTTAHTDQTLDPCAPWLHHGTCHRSEPRRGLAAPTQRHGALSPKVTSRRGRGTVCAVPEKKPDGWRVKGSASQELVDKEQEGN